MSNTNNGLTKEGKSVFWRWYFLGGAGWNYEKMQGLGYYFSMLPMIKKQKDEEARKTLAKTELQFFNTNNTMAPIIMGVDCALQDQTGAEAADTIAALKTGMMGPLAGIGDTLFHVIPSTIIGTWVDRETRRARITRRLRQRLEEGMVEEIKGLLKTVPAEDLIYYGLEYKFVTEYALGRTSYDEMFSRLEIAIHQFAKRQMTWFRGMERRGLTIHWIDTQRPMAEQVAEVLRLMA